MTSIFFDSRSSLYHIEKSRGDQTEIIARFTIEVLKLEDAGEMGRTIFIHILTRTIAPCQGALAEDHKYEANSESMLLRNGSEQDSSHQRKAILKLDSLDFQHWVNDWCIEMGGYNILDSGEEIKNG